MTTDSLPRPLDIPEATDFLPVCSTPGIARPLIKKSRCATRTTQEHSASMVTIRSLRETTIRPNLPVEILDAIFSYLPPYSLKPLLFANSFISTLARRRLYHSVAPTEPRNIVRFMKSVVETPELAALVRNLELHLNLLTPTSNFYALLRRTLRLMTSLISLSLELPKSHSPTWIFDSCIFRLKKFATTMYCRRPLALFLESQNSIVDLTLRGYQNNPIFLPFIGPIIPPTHRIPQSELFLLSPEALPHLRSFNAVHADASVVEAVVQGRPLQVVSIPLFSDMSIEALDALTKSTVPLKRLSIISFDPAAPSFLFEALSNRFRELEALHLVMLMAEYDNELLERSSKLLKNFKCLKFITFMAASPSEPLIQEATDSSSALIEKEEARIAKLWHKACPTLRTIILPRGKVWFQDSSSAQTQPIASSTTATLNDTASELMKVLNGPICDHQLPLSHFSQEKPGLPLQGCLDRIHRAK